MATKVFGYKQGSRSAKALADGLRGRVLKHEGSRYTYRDGDTIINWGSGQTDNPVLRNTLNPPAMVARASNKLTAFQTLQPLGIRVPPFWTNMEDIPDDAFPVVCRTVLNGHSGAGIVIADDRGALVNAPLYTKYVRKQDEYRIHVVRGQVISVQRKARRNDHENPNWQVRNLAGGFVYVRDGVNPPNDVSEQATAACMALDLDFGAVDVLWNERQQQAYVLEVNTAPGLEGASVDHYVEAFGRIVR